MPNTKQGLLQQHLDQIRDYVSQYKEDAYTADEETFKRNCEQVKRYINENQHFANINEIKSIQEKFVKLIDEALKINIHENEARRLRSGRNSNQASRTVPLGYTDYSKKINHLLHELEVDVDKYDLSTLTIKSDEFESNLARNIVRAAQVAEEKRQNNTIKTMVSPLVEPKPSFKKDQETVTEKASIPTSMQLVARKISKKIKSPKTYTQSVDNIIQKKEFKNELKFIESAIKYYKEFAKADSKYKEKHAGQEVKMARTAYAMRIREAVDLNKMLKNITLRQEERERYEERVKAVYAEKEVLLAHDEYTKIKEKGWLSPHKFKRMQHNFLSAAHYAENIQSMQAALDQINRLVKCHAIVAENNPKLLNKYHKNLIDYAKDERKELQQYMHYFQSNNIQYQIAKDLANKINQLKDRLKPIAHQNKFVDKLVEKHKKMLLERLNKKYETPEQAFADIDRVNRLFMLKQNIEEIEAKEKKIEAYYGNVERIYINQDTFRQQHKLNVEEVEKKLPADLRETYKEFIKENIDRHMIKLTDPNNFTDPDKTTNFDAIIEKISYYQDLEIKLNKFFISATAFMNNMDKRNAEIIAELRKTADAVSSLEVFETRQNLIDDYMHENLSLRQLILKPIIDKDAKDKLIRELSENENYLSEYENKLKLVISEHYASIWDGFEASRVANKAFAILESTNLPQSDDQHKEIIAYAKKLIEEMRKEIIFIMNKRPIAMHGAKEIKNIINKNRNEIVAIEDLKWLAEDGKKLLAQLIHVVQNEIAMLKESVTLLKDTDRPQSEINAMQGQVKYFLEQLIQLQSLNSRKLLSIDDAKKIRADIQNIEKTIADKVFKNAFMRINLFDEAAKTGIISQYELLDLKRYLATDSPHKESKELGLNLIYSELFNKSNNDYIKEFLPGFIACFDSLAEKVVSDRLYIVDKTTIKKILNDSPIAQENKAAKPYSGSAGLFHRQEPVSSSKSDPTDNVKLKPKS